MNRSRTSIIALSLLFILSLVIIACGSNSAATLGTPASADPTGRIFTLVGPKGGNILTMAQLKALSVTEGQGGIKSSTGQITIPSLFRGIALKDLVTYLNVPFDASMGVTVTAEDGYSMTFSHRAS